MNNEITASKVLENSKKAIQLSESSVGDISFQEQLLDKVIQYTYNNSILDKISSIVPLDGPIGKVYVQTANYAGNSKTAKENNTKVIKLTSTCPWTVGARIKKDGNNPEIATVRFVELNKVLLEFDVPGETFAVGDSITDGNNKETVKDVFSSRIAIKKVFNTYSGPFLTSDGEKLVPREINHSIRALTLTTQTRKIKSVLTREVIKDIQAQFGMENAVEIIAKTLAEEINNEVEQELFDYLRAIAREGGDLVVSDRDGSTDLIYAYTIIYTKIVKELADISKRTGRNIVGFAIASHRTVAALSASGALDLSKGGKTEQENVVTDTDYIGKALGYIDIIKSNYQDDEEVIVGFNAGKFKTDSGLIFSPYNLTITTATNPETGEENLVVFYRYAFGRNPFDEGTGLNDSDFFCRFTVDYSQVKQVI
jgi:hypothetical protein